MREQLSVEQIRNSMEEDLERLSNQTPEERATRQAPQYLLAYTRELLSRLCEADVFEYAEAELEGTTVKIHAVPGSKFSEFTDYE